MTVEQISADAGASKDRYDRLENAMARSVLGPTGFCCASKPDCEGSISTGTAFYEGQLSYVGSRYEVAVDGSPFRVLIVGMDTGRDDRCVTQGQRRKQVETRVDEPLSKRNPHMRGTTLALQVLFGSLDRGVRTTV